jgi:hypothetical protein
MKKSFNKVVSSVFQYFSIALTLLFAVPVLAIANPTASSAPTSVPSLASSVSFADVGIAILAIAGSIISLYVTLKGAQFVIRQVRGA